MARPIDDIAAVVRQAIIDALADRQQELHDIAVAGGDAAGGGILGDVKNLASILSSLVGPLEVLAGVAFPPLGLVEAAEAAGGKMGTGFGVGYLLGYTAYQALNPIFEHMNHAVADLIQSEIFDPQTAAMLQAKGIIDDAYGRSEAAGGNMSGEHYDKLVDAAQERPDVAQVMDAWLKDLVSEADVDAALAHHSIPPTWWPALKALKRQFLSPADLALANLRGVIDPTTMQGYANQLGVTPDDMQVLIENTGEPPGLMQMLEGYRRGFIDLPTLERGIRQSRVRNEWIPLIEALRFEPMTTADAARAVVENYITTDAGAAIAQENGLKPEHWPIIVESWGRPLSHEQMMTLFHRNEVTIDQVRQAFRESDLKDKYIDAAIELGRTLIPQRQVIMALQHGVIDRAKALDLLTIAGYTTDDANVLIDIGTAERIAAHKNLSRTDIVAMYEDALLTRDQATAHLQSLGYSAGDAGAMLDLADVKQRASLLRAKQRGIEASLKAHHLTQDQAVSQLIAAGVENPQAKALVDEWLQVRGVATRTLTEAQIKQLGEAGLISTDDARTRLQAYGLSQADANLLLKLWGLMK